jgi:hypothetical protein
VTYVSRPLISAFWAQGSWRCEHQSDSRGLHWVVLFHGREVVLHRLVETPGEGPETAEAWLRWVAEGEEVLPSPNTLR